MSRLWRAIDRAWRPEVPATRLAAVRILIGGFAFVYLIGRLPHLLSYGGFAANRFEPIGVVSLLEQPIASWMHQAVVVATIVAIALFTLGWRHRIVGPLAALLLLWLLTYRNSWGMIFHTENLLVLHVLILGLAPSAADAWSLDARRLNRPPGESQEHGWPLRLMALVTVVAYLLAGIAKIRFGGGEWLGGDVLRNYVATDNLKKILLGSPHSPLAAPLLHQAWLFSVLAITTMAVELGAPLAMLGRRIAVVWVAAIVGFHYGVLALMAIGFPYPMSGIAFACFFRAERIEGVWAWLKRRFRRGASPDRD